MPKFVLECPSCDTKFNLKRYVADKRVRCKKCRAIMKIPVVTDLLTPEEKARYEASHDPASIAPVSAFSLKRLLITASLLVVLLIAGVSVLITRGIHPNRPKPAPVTMTLEDVAKRNPMSPFPLGRGCEWTYKGGDKSEERRITNVSMSGDNYPTYDLAVSAAQAGSRQIIKVMPDASYLVEIYRGGERFVLSPPMKIIPHIVATGDSWKYEGEVGHEGGGSEKWKLDFKTDVESVDVPAGKFPCIAVTVTGKRGLQQVDEKFWYAIGTGLVRHSPSANVGVQDYKLTRFVIK